MTAHAKLSASGSEKWMTCTPSARLEENFPDDESEFAKEGTFAHAVFEQKLLTYLGREVEPLEDSHFDTPELRDYVTEAVEFGIERIKAAYERCSDPRILVERRLDFSEWVPEGFGTGDLVIVADDLVEVLDLKYGKGIFVGAEGNSQMRLYGLGAYSENALLYNIESVRMTILQPRLDNYSSEELAIDDLLSWAENEVRPKAALAWAGEGEFVAGDHCSSCFCKARFQCTARSEQALALAQQSFSMIKPEVLTLEQIAMVLERGETVAKWVSDVQSYALKQAEKGIAVPGYKLVEGRSNRRYKSQDLVAERLKEHGFKEAAIYERNLLGLTAMATALGKKRFDEVLGDLIEKPTGKPVLVPNADKRDVIESNHGFSAIADDRS